MRLVAQRAAAEKPAALACAIGKTLRSDQGVAPRLKAKPFLELKKWLFNSKP
jgi:hypothetical protein